MIALNRRARKEQRKHGALDARAELARRVLELDRAYPPPKGQGWCSFEVSAEQWNELVALAKAGQSPNWRRR